MNKLKKAVIVTFLLTSLCGLFGCKKPPEYTVNDIKTAAVSCSHMDFSMTYSFYLHREENVWLLDAEYATDTEQPRTEYANHCVSDEDVKELFKIIEAQETIKNLRRYKKPKLNITVADETSYYTLLGFTDGEKLGAPIPADNNTEECFRRLAEKYADPSFQK